MRKRFACFLDPDLNAFSGECAVWPHLGAHRAPHLADLPQHRHPTRRHSEQQSTIYLPVCT